MLYLDILPKGQRLFWDKMARYVPKQSKSLAPEKPRTLTE
jgi:hypothetical protein